MPMTKPLIDLLYEMEKYMELKGENPFKVRAFAKAAGALEDAGDDEDWVKRAKEGTLTGIPGIGKGISQVLTEFLLEGKSKALEELKSSLPEGLIELTKVPGLGPKKAITLIEELGIRSLAELEYACRENRLLNLKGFGEKVQRKILEGVQFAAKTQGCQRIDEAFPEAERLLPLLEKAAGGSLRIVETGALRRRMEILSEFDFMVETLPGAKTPKDLEEKLNRAVTDSGTKLPVRFHFATSDRFGTELVRTTGTPEHLRALGVGDELPAARTEEEFYQRLELPWIPPEMRETGTEVTLAREGKLADVLPWNGIRGVFHNHTVRSDGSATVEEMVLAARARGFQYIGISDHSQSAFYAQGLKVPTLLEQEREIREVQAKIPEVKIFWGIESDILADGSLDYAPEILRKFDFVVASIHSRFQMDRETMTSRILEAVRNPHTTMLGHVTGRLLLGRKGYEIDLERIVRECAKRGVAVEINSHPARLDIDWRWGDLLRETGCRVSINPDAHDEAGLDDTKYGIAVARKALLPRSAVVNSRDTKGVESWLRERR